MWKVTPQKRKKHDAFIENALQVIVYHSDLDAYYGNGEYTKTKRVCVKAGVRRLVENGLSSVDGVEKDIPEDLRRDYRIVKALTPYPGLFLWYPVHPTTPLACHSAIVTTTEHPSRSVSPYLSVI